MIFYGHSLGHADYSYFETLPDQHGENIVNRLVLEQRLNLFPTSKC